MNIKGEEAIEILRRKEVFQAFTDDANPLSIQVINRLHFLNTEDREKIQNASVSKKQAAVAIHEVLIKNYKDDAEGKISLADFIEALENQRTNVKLSKMLLNFCAGLNASDRECLRRITPTLIKDGYASELYSHMGAVFNDGDIQIINQQQEPADKVMKLIDIYGQKATSLMPLREALILEAQQHIVNLMDQVSAGTSGVFHSNEKINDIKASFQLMCENVRRVWDKLLNETSLEKCFVEPEIVEEEIDSDGQRKKKQTGKSVRSYKELFDVETLGNRIVIEGDPGMGKTTYVNNLALEWTWDDGPKNCSESSRFLQSEFNCVFLIPLRSLNGGVASTIAEAASIQLTNVGPWLNSKFESSPTECLLILDAFDEYDGSCSEINKIMDGSLFPRLKVIITTRPSHLKRLKIKNQWLVITGMTTPEKRASFLVKQGWKNPDERDMVTKYILKGFGNLWNNPLYLAMLCVLNKANKLTGFDPQKPNCFYVLVKLFTEHIMSRKSKEGTLQMEVFQLNEEERQKLKSYIQMFAIKQFVRDNPWISGVLKTPTFSQVFNTSRISWPFSALPNLFSWLVNGWQTSSHSTQELRELAGQFGLIIIREEQSPVTGEFSEMDTFVHRLFLEYYAAVHFQANCSTFNKDDLVKMIKENLDLSVSHTSWLPNAKNTNRCW